jgi:hypothetical protein
MATVDELKTYLADLKSARSEILTSQQMSTERGSVIRVRFDLIASEIEKTEAQLAALEGAGGTTKNIGVIRRD